MELVVMRHGRIQSNLEHRYAGCATDEPLLEEGREGARIAGCIEDVDRVYVSPLLRAKETAAICFPNAEQVVVADLREMDFGDFEGKCAAEMVDDWAYRDWVDGMCVGRCPGGESRMEFTARVAKAVHDIVCEERQRGAKRVIIVGHGGTVMAAFYTYAHKLKDDGEPYGYYDWYAPNCGGCRANVVIENGALYLRDSTVFEDLSFM